VRLVLGLGNPGLEYAWTRHNIGWLVVDALLEEVGDVPSSETRRLRRWGPFELEGSTVIAVKPLTYMNRSGLALYELPGVFLDNPRRILVVYDDMALPFGRLRLRKNGSAGGHNGMKSVLSVLGTLDVPRLRIGVAGANQPSDMARYVTSPFRPHEMKALPNILDRAVETIRLWAADEWDKAMQKANSPNPGEEDEDKG